MLRFKSNHEPLVVKLSHFFIKRSLKSSDSGFESDKNQSRVTGVDSAASVESSCTAVRSLLPAHLCLCFRPDVFADLKLASIVATSAPVDPAGCAAGSHGRSSEQRCHKLSFPHHTYKIQTSSNVCFTCLFFGSYGYVLPSAYFEDILFSLYSVQEIMKIP